MLRPLRLTVKIFLASIAVLAIAIMLFFWRVSNGPVLLDGYSPFLRNILVQQGVGNNIMFESSILTWRNAEDNPTGRSSFEVRFINIEIENQENAIKLNIPQAGMQFSITALFRGVVAPTFVEFKGLDLNVVIPQEAWAGEGFDQDVFFSTMRAYLDDFNKSQNFVPRLTKQILSEPDALTSTGYLQQLSLTGTVINVTDELSRERWNIPDALLDIKRTDTGLELLLEGNIDVENVAKIPLYMFAQYSISNEKADAEVRFSDFIPKNVAGKVQGLAALSNFDVPINGKINFSLDKSFELPIFSFEFATSNGTINPAKVYSKPVKIDKADIKGQYSTAESILQIDALNVGFSGAELVANGRMNFKDADPDVKLNATVYNLPLMQLTTYWPPELVVGARDWIETNVTGGMITDGNIIFDVRSEMWALDELPDESFNFKFNILGGSSHYLKPMPALTDLMGNAYLTSKEFLLNIQSGQINKVTVEKAELKFLNIAHKGEAIAHFEIPINGNVEEILHVIDYEPLGYPSLYGIKQNSILGKAKTHLTLDFPLLKSLKISDVEFKVDAEVEKLSIPELTDSLAISNGRMKLVVNGDGIDASGEIVLNGIDFEAYWKEDFTKENEFPTTYIVNGFVENNEWDLLDLPFQPYVHGTTKAYLKLNGRGSGLKSGEGSFEFDNTKITFDPLGWVKENNEQAKADFRLSFSNDDIININNITFNSKNMKSDAQLTFNGERVTRLFVKDLKMNDTDISALFEWDKENSLYQTSVKGGAFNAVPLMDIILSPYNKEEKTDLPDFNFAGYIDNILLYNDISMRDVSVLTEYKNNEVVDFGYNGNWADDKNLSIILANVPNEDMEDGDKKQQHLTLKTNDAGQALRGLDFFTSADQGDLIIDAVVIRKENGLSFKGTIEADDFRVANSPAFSELLKEKEFIKAQEELEDNGLSFESFKSEFEQYDEVMTLKSGSAKGPTLGITLDGYVDQKFDEVALNGTIIPAYGINSLLSNIPVLGTILAGGKGEGVFAATYTMSGSIEEPDVKINPLMALAPGIFRKIFGAIGGKGPNTPAPRDESSRPDEKQAIVEPEDPST